MTILDNVGDFVRRIFILIVVLVGLVRGARVAQSV